MFTTSASYILLLKQVKSETATHYYIILSSQYYQASCTIFNVTVTVIWQWIVHYNPRRSSCNKNMQFNTPHFVFLCHMNPATCIIFQTVIGKSGFQCIVVNVPRAVSNLPCLPLQRETLNRIYTNFQRWNRKTSFLLLHKSLAPNVASNYLK